MNENWARWIFASVSKYFETACTGVATKFYVEGEERLIKDTEDTTIEIRVDGPDITDMGGGQYRLYVEVNVLVGIKKSLDSHAIYRIIGPVQVAMASNIKVYKYGPDTEGVDTSALLGCLQLLQGMNKEKIKTSVFGQIEKSTFVEQATVEGHFEMYLEV